MSIQEAEQCLKTAVMGQPLHRENLGAENESNGTLRGVSPVSLKLAPQLQRELSQELQNAPNPAPTLSVPKMGIGGNSMKSKGPNLQNRSPKPPTQGGSDDK